MSMLKSFFEIGADEKLFDGLAISEEKELCDRHMGKYPVISVSLKQVDGLSFEEARKQMRTVVGAEAERFSFLKDSDKLGDNDKEKFVSIIKRYWGQNTGLK